MNKIDFLAATDVYSINKTNLEIFQKMSPSAEFTDYAYFSINNPYLFRNGRWWLKSCDGEGNVDVVCGNEKCFSFESDNSCVGTRPAMKFSSVKNDITNIQKNKFGVLEGEYGEYIQRLITNEEKKELDLELAYLHEQCCFTGKTYQVIMPCNYLVRDNLKIKEVAEYMYCNRKFVRIEDSFNVSWFEVLPIKWLISPKEDIMLSKHIILGRLPIYLEGSYYTESDFENTDIYQYLNNVFVSEITNSKPKVKQKTYINK